MSCKIALFVGVTLSVVQGDPADHLFELAKGLSSHAQIKNAGSELMNLKEIPDYMSNPLKYTFALDGEGVLFLMMFWPFQCTTQRYHHVGGFAQRLDFRIEEIWNVHSDMQNDEFGTYGFNLSNKFVETNYAELLNIE